MTSTPKPSNLRTNTMSSCSSDVESLNFHPALGAYSHRQCNSAAVGTFHHKQKFSYADRRHARNILRHKNVNYSGTHSTKWLKKLDWARMVLPHYGLDGQTAQNSPAKRQHLPEIQGPVVKKAKILPQRTLAEYAKDHTLIGVIDQSDAEGRIPRNQWKMIEAALIELCFEMLELEPGPPPVCKDVGWYHGNAKIIACKDDRSVKLYKAAVAKLGEIYPGAKLIAVDWSEVPSRPRAHIWLPMTMNEPDKILKMLQRCNPELPTHDWRVVNVECHPMGSSIQAVLLLNKESLAPIEAANGQLNFGFISVGVRVYRSDAAAAAVSLDKRAAPDPAVPDVVPPPFAGYSYDISMLTRDMMTMSHEDDDLIGDVIDDLDADTSAMESLLQDIPAEFEDPLKKTPASN